MPVAAHPQRIAATRLRRAARTLARIVAAPGGEAYAPLFERVEAELAAIDRARDVRARARAFLEPAPDA